MDVETLLLPSGYDDSDYLYSKIISSARRNGTEIIEVKQNMTLDFGDIGLELYRLGTDDENEKCIVSKLEVGGIEVLAMADSTYRMEKELVRDYNLEDVDAFVVSHHGSKYSSCDEFLKEIKGKYAVISVGTNYFGHPHEETLEALKTYGYNILRTDLNGDIELRIGNNYG